jgi:oligoribonuclease NrnB/cAMP/cGMP phosphodiesterase (DHH superfamily)
MAVDWTKLQPKGVRSWIKSRVDGVACLHPETADFIFQIWEDLEHKNRLGNQTAIDVIQVVMRHARKQIKIELQQLDDQIARKKKNTTQGDKTPKLDALIDSAISRAFDKYYTASQYGKRNEDFRARMAGKI